MKILSWIINNSQNSDSIYCFVVSQISLFNFNENGVYGEKFYKLNSSIYDGISFGFDIKEVSYEKYVLAMNHYAVL